MPKKQVRFKEEELPLLLNGKLGKGEEVRLKYRHIDCVCVYPLRNNSLALTSEKEGSEVYEILKTTIDNTIIAQGTGFKIMYGAPGKDSNSPIRVLDRI